MGRANKYFSNSQKAPATDSQQGFRKKGNVQTGQKPTSISGISKETHTFVEPAPRGTGAGVIKRDSGLGKGFVTEGI